MTSKKEKTNILTPFINEIVGLFKRGAASASEAVKNKAEKGADLAAASMKRAKKTREAKKRTYGFGPFKWRVDPSNPFNSPLKNTHEYFEALADELEARERAAKRKAKSAKKADKTKE